MEKQNTKLTIKWSTKDMHTSNVKDMWRDRDADVETDHFLVIVKERQRVARLWDIKRTQ